MHITAITDLLSIYKIHLKKAASFDSFEFDIPVAQ